MPRVQRDRGRASDHIDQEVVSWSYILGRFLAGGVVDQVAVVAAAAVVVVVVAAGAAVVAVVAAVVDVDSILAAGAGPWVVEGSGIGSRGTDPGLLPRYLGHRPYRFARRTPVLNTQNQSRTNMVP